MSSEENKPAFRWPRLNDRQRRQQRQMEAQSALDRQASHEARPATSGMPLTDTGLTLADLRPGECGTIIRICGSVQGRLRLLEMGLTPGTHIKVIHAAAFGGPLDILVRGYQLSLRREEAASVWLGDEEDFR
jgi:Fe2+ transport system protein FeoA